MYHHINKHRLRLLFGIPVILLIAALFAGCNAPASEEDAPASSCLKAQSASLTDIPDEDTVDPADVPKGLFRMGWFSLDLSCDVHRITSNYIFAMNVYDTLFETVRDANGDTRLEPALVKSYTLSDDGLTYSFTLRDDVRFSDGSPLTAKDVAYTFTRMLALPDSQQTSNADAILGAQDVIDGRTDTLEGIEVIDDTHINITLSAPSGSFIQQLATPPCGILSADFTEAAGESYGEDPEHTLGTGPYIYTTKTKTLCEFEKNPLYWRKISNVDRVEIRQLVTSKSSYAFLHNQTDILVSPDVSADVMNEVYEQERWKDQTISFVPMQMKAFMLNEAYPGLSDIRVRRAIQYAINREGILRDVYGGNGHLIDGILPKGLYGYSEANQGWLTYDPDRARDLIKQAGAEGLSIEIAANVESETQTLQLLARIRDDLQAVGLNAHLVNYDNDAFLLVRRQGWLMSHEAIWSADYNDPDNFLYTFFGSRINTANRSINYYNDEIIRRVAGARSIVNENDRLAEYAALEKKIIRDDAAMVPLFTIEIKYILGDRIAAFTPYWAGWESFCFKDIVLKE